jgi:hypothetical protein
MDLLMMENGIKTRFKDMGNILGMMVEFMMECGYKIIW